MKIENISHTSNQILVTVCFVSPDRHWQTEIHLQAGSNVRDALNSSGFLKHFPTFDLTLTGVGVYGKLVPANHVLAMGDRVEIYRPLTYDPKISRRRRAIHREKARNIKKKVPFDDLTKL